MIGMGFTSFLTVLVIAAVVSLVMYFVGNIRLQSGYWMQLIVSWFGAWLGSPVFGHWFEKVEAGGVYIIPAILGAIALTWFCRARESAAQAPISPSE